MAKKPHIEQDPILPTEIEAHLGEVSDPRGHEDEIKSAVHVLQRFCVRRSRFFWTRIWGKTVSG
ncbi:MAG TPA: hypothetical protein PLZ79_05160, partial [Burkholderiales bacterium]|nr:hypothetical protein [Burkholderiales bacterium]